MKRLVSACLICVLAACASKPFDRTNIEPGERVYGPAVSVEVPTDKSWFAVDYGTGNRIRLSQLNFDDSYTIRVAINRGPITGMFSNAEEHLAALIKNINKKPQIEGVVTHSHDEWIEPRYGGLCVAYSSTIEDWRGRNTSGPALVDMVGLTCPHRHLENVLVNVEISHRYEVDGPRVDLMTHAHTLFASIEHEGGD